MNLVSIPGNDKCADCTQPLPRFSAFNLGILICESCATIHRSLGSHISKVKSLSFDNWDESLLKVMATLGNSVVNAKYEENVPACYRKPQPNDPHVIREQWIRAKYERKEFVGQKALPYLSGFKEGFLWKKGKDDKHFQKRRFVLDTTENTLKYFNKEESRDPKATLRLDGINLMVVPEKVGHANAMQITFEQNDQTRNLFIYTDDGKDLIDWYTAIRAAKLNRLQIAYPQTDINSLSKMIMWEYVKEGWLSKTGPRPGDVFRRRWVTVDKRKLVYYEDRLCPYPKAEIFISGDGFEVQNGFINSASSFGKDALLAFVLKTPERSFQFLADTAEEAMEWVVAIKTVIDAAN